MNKLIIIHIDAFSYEYVDRAATPFLYGLCQKTVFKRMAQSRFFQANLSAYTGADAGSHGRIVEYVYDPDNSPFYSFKKFAGILDRLDKFMPCAIRKLWRHALSWCYTTCLHKPPVKLHLIPFSICHNFNFSFNRPYIKNEDIFMKVRKAGLRTAWDDEDFVSNVKRRWMGTYFHRLYPEAMIDWAKERIKQGVDFIWVDLGAELDKFGHKYGPEKTKFISVLNKIDRNLEKLIKAAEKHKYRFIVFSDHGMEHVKGVVDISSKLNEEGLINGENYIGFYDSTLARFWIKNNDIKEKLKEVISRIEHGSLLEEKDSIKYGIPMKDAISDVVFAVDQGYLLVPNFYQGNKMVMGMHGYLEDKQGPLDGIFVTGAQQFKCDAPDGRMRIKDIAELVLKSIGIK